MAYYIIESFNSGLDLRRSREVAAIGSLRVLRNAFINSGGEIEKRKAFVVQEELTDYGQNANYKNSITGPHQLPGRSVTVFFTHRHNSLPGAPFTPGLGTISEILTLAVGPATVRVWATKSLVSRTDFGGLQCTSSDSVYEAGAYIVRQFLKTTGAITKQHIDYTIGVLGEPTTETAVTANDGHEYQIMLGNKGYSVQDDTFYVSAIGDPTDMTGTGSATVNGAGNGFPVGDYTALGEYFGELAVFGRRGVQFYSVSSDPAATQYNRTIQITLAAPRTITSYGAGDIIYLARDGIRSLQARDSSNFAQVNDVGSPIDSLIQAELAYDATATEYAGTIAGVNDGAFYNLAKGIILNENGQYWLALKDKIYVLSRHPAAKVLAWSIYDMPTPDPANVDATNIGTRKSVWMADACPIGDTIMFRNFADEIYVYGGETTEEYDASEVEVITPYIDMGIPEDHKHFTGISLVCQGTWTVQVSTTVTDDQETYNWETVATVSQPTRGLARVSFQSYGQQIAIRLVSTSAVAAKVAQISVIYEKSSAR